MIFINGNIQNTIDIDSTLFFGRGVFETINVREKPILLEKHIDRLNNSSKKLSLQIKVSEEEVKEFIKKHNIKNCVLKITVTEKSLIYSIRENQYNKEEYFRGFKVGISKVLRNSTSRLTYIKSTCYIENIIEKEKALEEGLNEVIFLNEKGFITEGCTCNLFFIKDKVVYTPTISCGLLDGIIRQWIIDNFEVQEGEFLVEDLLQSDEIFLTNSLMGIMHVKEFLNKQFNKTENTLKLMKKYKEFILEDKND